METIKLVFWEALKVLSLAFVGVAAAKSLAGLKAGSPGAPWVRWIKAALYVAISGLTLLGARAVGYDLTAEMYVLSSQKHLAGRRYVRAYENAVRAVQLRPRSLRYWRNLAATKIAQGQFQSALDDMPAFQSLSGSELDEEDSYRFALCHFYLGEYEKVLELTHKTILRNRLYAAPHVLQGMAYTAQKKYRDAELSFLNVLQTFPAHQPAVEGLAHAYFLEGNRGAAMRVLDETARHPFSSNARRRFAALKALYAQ